jgi:dihydropyrimidinase
VADLLIAGGTVVGATGSSIADVLVRGEVIADVAPDLARTIEGVDAVDATGLLVFPGVIDVHTHTRVPSDAEPDRFFQDSVAAAHGGTTTFLSFDNPGTGSDTHDRPLVDAVADWRSRTAGQSAVDVGLSLVLTRDRAPRVAELPAVVESGVPTVKAFMVYDFGVDEATIRQALLLMRRAGGMLQLHCEDRGELETRTAALLAANRTEPRFHALSRPPQVEADGIRRATALARATDTSFYAVHVSSRAALDAVREAMAHDIWITVETCPHYLTLDDARYSLPAEEAARYVISPPLRTADDRRALWESLAAGETSHVVATDHVPDRLAVEKANWREPFDRISNGAPGIETLLTLVYSEGVAMGRIDVERMVDLLAATPARLFGLRGKGSLAPGKDADIVLFDPRVRRAIRQADLHHTSDYTPYEGFEVSGAVRSVYVRGRTVIEDGRFVGERGWGRFVERALTGD